MKYINDTKCFIPSMSFAYVVWRHDSSIDYTKEWDEIHTNGKGEGDGTGSGFGKYMMTANHSDVNRIGDYRPTIWPQEIVDEDITRVNIENIYE